MAGKGNTNDSIRPCFVISVITHIFVFVGPLAYLPISGIVRLTMTMTVPCCADTLLQINPHPPPLPVVWIIVK